MFAGRNRLPLHYRTAPPRRVLCVARRRNGPDTISAGLKALNGLRKQGIAAEIFPKKTKLGKQFGYADKKNIPFVLVIGADEIQKGTFVLKNMEAGDQDSLSWEALLARLQG